MKRFWLFALAIIPMIAQAGTPEVDRDEVLRRGDMVTKAGDGLVRSANDTVNEALAIPADDSDKWYITLVVTPNCQACDLLKADFQRKPELMAFANPIDPKKSWAHFNVYMKGDRTQDWRWKDITFKAFPTLIVQPPRNGQFGDPKTTIWQFTGYDGDSKKLSQGIRDKIVAYARKASEWRPYAGTPAQDEGSPNGGYGGTVQAPFYSGPCPGPYCPQTPQPTVYPSTAPVPFPFDTPGPTPSSGATLEQLKQAIPAASDTFLLEQLTKKATLEDALKAWVAKGGQTTVSGTPAKFTELQKALPDAPTTFLMQQLARGASLDDATLAWHASNPTQGLTTTIVGTLIPLMGGATMVGVVVLILTWWRKGWTATGHKPFLSDEQFQDLIKLVKGFDQTTQTTSTTPPTK